MKIEEIALRVIAWGFLLNTDSAPAHKYITMNTIDTNPFLNVSQAFTSKFLELDRILFRWSPYLTLNESHIILDKMELYAQSKFEGNWTTSDCYQFLADVLGKDRLQLITMMEQVDNARAQQAFIAKEQKKNETISN